MAQHARLIGLERHAALAFVVPSSISELDHMDTYCIGYGTYAVLHRSAEALYSKAVVITNEQSNHFRGEHAL